MPWREYASLADVEKIVSELTWLWPNIIPNGYLTVIAGQPGIAKSAWALDLVARVLSGTPWPDGTPCKEVPFVMWADTEATQAMLLDRAKSLGLDPARIVFPFDKDNVLGDVKLDDAAKWAAFKSSVEECSPPVVIIDSLASAHSSDEDKSKNMNLICGRLMRLARDNNNAVIAIHQVRKQGEEYKTELTLDDLRGSGAIGYEAKCVSVIEPV
ncbi:MAG: AAA family ATPase, partial [Acidobacteria bacterium]|nr:AAA family ATPase [Acidobacteriota bacterium]